MVLLIDDLKENRNEWENNTLETYLEAIVRCTEDLDGYYINRKLTIPQNIDWKVFANILVSAKMYE